MSALAARPKKMPAGFLERRGVFGSPTFEGLQLDLADVISSQGR